MAALGLPRLCCRDYYTPTSGKSVPTGEMEPVNGTALDFTSQHAIGERIDELAGSRGAPPQPMLVWPCWWVTASCRACRRCAVLCHSCGIRKSSRCRQASRLPSSHRPSLPPSLPQRRAATARATCCLAMGPT